MWTTGKYDPSVGKYLWPNGREVLNAGKRVYRNRQSDCVVYLQPKKRFVSRKCSAKFRVLCSEGSLEKDAVKDTVEDNHIGKIKRFLKKKNDMRINIFFLTPATYLVGIAKE